MSVMPQPEQHQKFDEPKEYYTVLLMQAQERIAFLINESKYGQAAHEMATFLLRVEIPEKEEAMNELSKKLTLESYASFRSQDTNAAFATICGFLNRTYFADYHKARPVYGRGKL